MLRPILWIVWIVLLLRGILRRIDQLRCLARCLRDGGRRRSRTSTIVGISARAILIWILFFVWKKYSFNRNLIWDHLVIVKFLDYNIVILASICELDAKKGIFLEITWQWDM